MKFSTKASIGEGTVQRAVAQISRFCGRAIEDLLRHPQDRSEIGLILCRSRYQAIAGYALRDVNKPIAVARYQQEWREVLPSVARLEAELAAVDGGAINEY
jgi:hypothetical protein